MFDYNTGQAIMRVIAVVLSLTVHEYSHALISTLQGDDVPDSYGRLTLNPFAHMDIIGLISLYLFRFGWAKPVPISSRNYRFQKLGIILTSIAGPFSNLLLAFFSAVILYAFNVQSEGLSFFLTQLFIINISLAVFNLIPVPPLDGSKVIAELAGGRIADFIYSIERIGIMVLFIILWIPQVNYLLYRIILFVAGYIEYFASRIA